MLKEIFAQIRKLKSPEAALVVLLLLASTIVVSTMYQKSSGAYVVNLEAKNHTLEAQKDSIQRAMQKTIDECHQSALQERLDKIRQLENYNRLQDSIINKLRSIK